MGVSYPTNPKFDLTPQDFEMLRLWRLFSPGMGVGHLPQLGGSLEQSCLMLDCFAVMSGVERELDKHYAAKDSTR